MSVKYPGEKTNMFSRKSLITLLAIITACLSFPASGMAGSLSGKKALLIIAPGDFRDEELFDTQDVLEKAGASISIASRKTGEFKGMLGKKAVATIKMSAIHAADYDAVVFIGGSGAAAYIDDKKAHAIAQEKQGAGSHMSGSGNTCEGRHSQR